MCEEVCAILQSFATEIIGTGISLVLCCRSFDKHEMKSVLEPSSLGMLSLTPPLCTQLSVRDPYCSCRNLHFLCLEENCNISALSPDVIMGRSHCWISLKLPPERLHWLIFSFLRNNSFRHVPPIYLRGSGWARGRSRAQRSKAITSYINN